MVGRFKYDVAISVAEEDCQVAALIDTALEKENIKCYYYKKYARNNWGKDIIEITQRVYGSESRCVLVITSERYAKKYWAGIELQTVINRTKNDGTQVLQLRLDDTQIDGISGHTVHHEWHDNAAEIAEIVKEKVKKDKHTELTRISSRMLPMLLLIGALVWSLIYRQSSTPNSRMQTFMQAVSVTPVGKKIPIMPQGMNGGINPFFISATEVTIAEYREFCQAQKIDLPSQNPLSDRNMPVTNITWYEAQAYCKWKKGRLPTETEWEYAASAGQATKYSGGNNAAKVAVYRRDRPDQVATRAANDFGLFDMTGNVAEWCNDWSDAAETLKSVRGGACIDRVTPLNELAVSFRTKEHPDVRSPYIGFRVVWDE